MFGKKICELKGITRIYMKHFITLIIQRAVEVFNRTVQSLFTSWKTTKNKNNKVESYKDLLIQNNDRDHLNTKVAHLRAVINVENKDLI